MRDTFGICAWLNTYFARLLITSKRHLYLSCIGSACTCTAFCSLFRFCIHISRYGWKQFWMEVMSQEVSGGRQLSVSEKACLFLPVSLEFSSQIQNNPILLFHLCMWLALLINSCHHIHTHRPLHHQRSMRPLSWVSVPLWPSIVLILIIVLVLPCRCVYATFSQQYVVTRCKTEWLCFHILSKVRLSPLPSFYDIDRFPGMWYRLLLWHWRTLRRYLDYSCDRLNYIFFPCLISFLYFPCIYALAFWFDDRTSCILFSKTAYSNDYKGARHFTMLGTFSK